jgi:Zn-dependent peptidase ImmA (M78 family)
MAKIRELAINPDVLKWARRTAGLSIKEVAYELKVKEDFILAIESGQHKAGKTVLRKLAQMYDRPFTVLLLPNPPTEDDIPTDYRTLPVPKQQIGPRTAQALREARRLQEALSDLKYDDPDILPSFEPIAVDFSDRPSDVASAIRKALDIDVDEQKRWPDIGHAFRQWRGKLQSKGILVIIQDFPREEARGFSLWHPLFVPMIVVSQNEAPAAQIFTLFHELVHTLLRSDAMCLRQETQTFSGTVEAWCNKVAAATLVPEADLKSLLSNQMQAIPKEWSLDDLHWMASRFKVSRHVIAIRLEEMGFAPRGYYHYIKGALDPDDYAIKPRPVIDEREEHRRDIPKKRLAEFGFVATNAILEACKKSALSTIEAADLLGVRPTNFGRLLALASDQSRRYG